MAITHVTSIRDTLANAVVDAIDGGAGDAAGDLVIMTSGDGEVATLAFNDPAFGASSSGTATYNGLNDDTNAFGGVAALFKVQDKSNAEIFRGTVTATGGGGDLELSSTTIGGGDTVSINSFTYTAPP
jgi:hypothetical protein